jgi:hypothetical protein
VLGKYLWNKGMYPWRIAAWLVQSSYQSERKSRRREGSCRSSSNPETDDNTNTKGFIADHLNEVLHSGLGKTRESAREGNTS